MTQNVAHVQGPRELSILEALRIYCTCSRFPPLQAQLIFGSAYLPYTTTYLALHVLSSQDRHSQRKASDCLGGHCPIWMVPEKRLLPRIWVISRTSFKSSPVLILLSNTQSFFFFSTKGDCKFTVIKGHMLTQEYIYQLLEKMVYIQLRAW